MKKLKLSVGILAFMGLAALNFTQSESSFVSKALASSSSCSCSCSSNCTCGCQSSGSSTSSEDPNYAYAAILSSVECPITKVNGEVAIVVRGVTVAPHASYVDLGTKLNCEFYLLARCDQSKVTICQEIK